MRLSGNSLINYFTNYDAPFPWIFTFCIIATDGLLATSFLISSTALLVDWQFIREKEITFLKHHLKTI